MKRVKKNKWLVYVVWLVLVASMGLLKHFILFFICLIITLFLFAGVADALINRNKYDYLHNIDRMSEEEFYDTIMKRILKDEYGIISKEKVLCIIKRGYVADEDIEMRINGEEAMQYVLATNSVYRGSLSFRLLIDRKMLEKYYRKLRKCRIRYGVRNYKVKN